MVFRNLLIASVVVVVFVSGQIMAQLVTSRPPRTIDQNRQDQASRQWYEELRKRENVQTGIGSIRETAETLIAVLRDEAKKKLNPTEDEKRSFADFLKQPKTGLIRLAAETDCSRILDIAHPDTQCLNYYIPGKARAYSFRKADYSHQAYADVERANGLFVAPGTYVLGLITSLGDIEIEAVTAENPHVLELLGFSPANDLDAVIRQDQELGKGLAIGGLTYRKSVPIRENDTYLLRSVAYRAKFYNMPKSEKRRGSLDVDERRDVVVVFRFVRKEIDDSYLLLWKEIRQATSPQLEVNLAKQ